MKAKKKRKKKRRLKKSVKVFLLLSFLSLVVVISFFTFFNKEIPTVLKKKEKNMFLASSTAKVSIFKKETKEEEGKEASIILVEKEQIGRGKEVKAYEDKIEYEEKEYQKIKLENKVYYVLSNTLVDKKTDSVQEKNIYTRTATSILENMETRKIAGFTKKGEELSVIGYDKIEEDGSVHVYEIQKGEQKGYVYGKYMSFDKETSLKNYEEATYNPIHEKVRNTYDGGEAIKLDFYPNIKPSFEKNKMPDAVYALYLNCGSTTIKNIDAYINFAKNTKINAFVVDIKDNETPAYPAKTFQNLSPSNYDKAINSYDEYKNAITKLKENGFYVIGRITTFKDSYYVKDHPEDAILNKYNNSPFLHNGSYWPSAYNRNVWYYTLSLAREAVQEFGFNEINFDYVRFPDRMNSVMSSLDLKNTYNEDKAEAIQRFVQYVTDGLHDMNTYVSIDVFGESTNGSYVTAYGQYWPAISNVADVISGMPYPDHFAANSYGIAKPWNNPYLLMKYWGSYAMDRQKECPTPARIRTWIQAYDVMRYVDSNGISYNAEAVEKEIRGLYDSGIRDGYITWLSNSSLDKYKAQEKAFQIDYRKEYTNEQNNN